MKALEDVVLLKIDAEAGEGRKLAESYSVKSYPNYVLANSRAETMDRWAGYAKDHFLATLSDGLADPTTIEEKAARLEKDPTADDAARLGRYHGTRGEFAEAAELYERANALGSDDYTYEIFENVARGVREEQFEVADATKAANALVSSGQATSDQLVDVWHMMGWLGRKLEDPALADAYIEPALTATTGLEEEGMQHARRDLQIAKALRITGDKEGAVTLKREAMPEGWKDDATQLNRFSWWCFENLVNLEEAEALARRGIDLAPEGADRAAILDTAAEICNARGNCDDAVELAREAVANDSNRELYKEQLERFENIRAASAN